jgi:hypothetical protein
MKSDLNKALTCSDVIEVQSLQFLAFAVESVELYEWKAED